MRRAALGDAAIIALLGMFVGIGGLSGQPRPGEATAAPLLLSPHQAQEDFDVLRGAIEEAHGGLHRFVSKSQLDRRFAGHRARLGTPMSTMRFGMIVSEAIAEIGDGHARLEWDSVTTAALADALVLPLRVQLEGDRLKILFNDAPADSSLGPGMDVLRINGHPVGRLLQSLGPTISGDGFIESGRRARLARTLPQLLWLFVAQADSYTVVARDRAGRRVTTTLPGIRESDRLAAANPGNAPLTAGLARVDAPPGNVALQFLAESGIARLRIRAFNGPTFPATLDSAFQTLRDSATRGLILDLRGNGGGVDEYGALLVSYLVQQPFQYFDHIQVATIAPSFATWLPRTFDALRAGTVPGPNGGYRVTAALHPGVGEQRPATRPFLGKLVVLIDGATFSTAADVAAQLRSRRRASFVGEETAGAYEGNTSGLNALIVLPHSRLRFKVMMYGYWNAVEPAERRGRGVLPDQAVATRVDDLIRGIDRPLQRAIDLVRP